MIKNTTGIFKTFEPPPLEVGQARYIMAANGIFQEQNDDMFDASSMIHEFYAYRKPTFDGMNLLPHHEFFTPKFPKIPEDLIAQCLGFFSYVEHKHDWECGLVLLYNPETYQYSWCCPDQECSGASLKWTAPIPGKDYSEEWVHFGDVHLHPGMSAYHSGTDHDDEMTASDGLHLVVGTPNDWNTGTWDKNLQKTIGRQKKEAEWCATFVSDGARFKVEPEVVLENIKVKPSPFPKVWYSKCKKLEWGWQKPVTGFAGGAAGKEVPSYDRFGGQYD